MVMMMFVSGMHLVKVAFRAVTGLIFHLHGCVVNLILLFKKMMNSVQEGIVIVWGHYLYV